MDETVDQDGRVAELRQALERAVRETGSLTHERVLRASRELDRAILAYFPERSAYRLASKRVGASTDTAEQRHS